MIYLDNAATVKPSKNTVALAERILTEDFFNPSALYYPAIELKGEIENTRRDIADILKCKASEIYFTSCATESNNWVFSCGIKNKRGNVVISEGEHPSVYEAALNLKSKGVDVRVIPLTVNGTIDETKLCEAVDDNTALVSVIHVSNETGIVNQIEKLAAKVKNKNKNTFFHSDGVQAFCKVPLNLSGGNIDFYSISAHKIGGIKGAGALYLKSGVNISPLLYGGGQENRMRSGTENVLSVLSFATAFKDFRKPQDFKKVFDYAFDVLSMIPDSQINGLRTANSGYIISLGLKGIKAEVLQHLLCDKGIMIGLGSACSSKNNRNRTLESMRVNREFVEGNIRLSFSYENTFEEVKNAIGTSSDTVGYLRSKIHG